MKNLLLPLLLLSSGLYAQVKWEKQFHVSGNAFTVIESASQVVETPDKGYLIAGNARTSSERPFGFLMKIAANGDSLWCRIYDTVYIPRVAGIFYNRSNELMGIFERHIVGQKTDIVFARINETNGDTSGSFTVPKPFGVGGHLYRKHVELADGSYVVAGHDNSATSLGAGTLLRFMPGSSTPMWEADSLARKAAVYYDMILDGDKLVLAGTNASLLLKSNFYIAKYDLDGETVWQRTLVYPGEWAPTSAAYAIRKNDAGNYLVSGHWVIKPQVVLMAGAATAVIGPGGDSLSMHIAPNNAYSIVRSTIKNSGVYYGAGLINGTVQVDNIDHNIGYMGAYSISEQGNTTLMNKFNNTGVVKTQGGSYLTSNADAAGLVAARDGDLVIFGHSQYYSEQAGKMQQCTYIVKYTPEPVTTGLNKQDAPGRLTVYPNPSSDLIFIGNGENTLHQLQITDLAGRIVYTQGEVYGAADISALKPGLYMIRCTGNNQLYTGRFIKAN